MSHRSPSFGFITVLMLIGGMPVAVADDESWSLEVPVLLAAGSNLQHSGDTTFNYHAAEALVEFRWRSPARPWSASMFVDYRVASDRRVADTFKVGVMFRHKHSDWDTLASVFRAWPDDRPAAWGYFGRIRYRLAGPNKIGVESFGRFRQLDGAYVLLAWYRDLSSSLTLQIGAGSDLGRYHDIAARAELVWQVN